MRYQIEHYGGISESSMKKWIFIKDIKNIREKTLNNISVYHSMWHQLQHIYVYIRI